LAEDAQRVAQLPRIFQANIHRLYERVIAASIEALPLHPEIVTGEAPSMDAFLDRAKAQVDNYTANEANKVYTLVLIGLFERQLRVWASHILDVAQRPDAKETPFLRLLDATASVIRLDVTREDLRITLEEAFEVGNVVRHGEGRALSKLGNLAPHLIDRSKRDYVDLLAVQSPDSEWLRIRASDVERYADALIRFWGSADRLPGAVYRIALHAPAFGQPS
jgi:hypothetical protein